MVPLRILQFKFLVQSNLNTLAESQLTIFINPFVCISINIFHTWLETLVMELSFEMLGSYFSVSLKKAGKLIFNNGERGNVSPQIFTYAKVFQDILPPVLSERK